MQVRLLRNDYARDETERKLNSFEWIWESAKWMKGIEMEPSDSLNVHNSRA